MLVDLARIHVLGGRGGRGCISFRREKYVPKGGPDGGNGGRGGSVVFRVDPHVRTLLDLREAPRHQAGHGAPGSGNNRTGKDGADEIIRVPPGTVVRDLGNGNVIADLVEPEADLVVARGGRGGRGNAMFATPTHQAPRRADPGEQGEERHLELELKLIADVGLVGLPNAGKSTMLSRVSRARPRIGDYPFTTLEPNLGIAKLDDERQLVIADLPGLIEGAHLGKGLGLDFLRHVERTRVIAVLIDATSASPAGDLDLLLHELTQYGPALGEKPRMIVLTKADLIAPGERAEHARACGLPDARLVSAHAGDGLKDTLETMWKISEESMRAEGVQRDG